MIKRKLFDILIILILTCLAFIVSMKTSIRPLFSMMMFYIVPAAYIILRSGKINFKKVSLITFVIATFAGALDAMVTANKGWWIPEDQLVFHFRFLGLWNLDNTLWYAGMAFYLVIFYEYFFDSEKSHKLSKLSKYFLLFPIAITLVFLLLYYFFPNILFNIRYAYLTVFAPLIFAPAIVLLFLARKNAFELFGKFTLVAMFFFFVNILHEISALSLGQWIFPGEYIGTVHLAGVVIPIEEFVMYIIFSAYTGLAYYEIFVDDRK